ncbi:MAG: hypothetical protein NC227_10940 [Bacteroides sp.]|nr:hypothetical protein [Bacteroides sp.]MCM1363286.1 hypothetical protein [Clostridiales bacterium]
MAIYDIAGLKIKINNPKGRTKKQAIPYLAENQDENQHIDITIDVTEQKVLNAMKEHPELVQDDWYYMLTGSDFYSALIGFNGILLHSSCIVVDGKAYAFSADSGTGKSTHTELWLKYFGERAYMLNDDKPAIRLIDGKVYACGTPWSGKYDYSSPKVVELAGICFLERSENNWIKKADTGKAVFNIFSQTIRNFNQTGMDRLFDVLEQIFEKVPLYEFGCNISEDALMTSYNAMAKGIME